MSALVVVSIGPLASIQDAGRPGLAHLGVPCGGAWDPEARAAAIAAVDGALDDAVIELPLVGARFRCVGEVHASIDGEPARAWRDGDVLEIPRIDRAVRVVAVRGGIDVPRVLGSRSTLVVAGLGGLDGRALRRDDVVPIDAHGGATHVKNSGAPASLPLREVLDAIAVADADPVLLARLASIALRVSPRSDRVGTRFDGEPIVGATAVAGTRPLVPGTVELPPDGHPIVLGPDGPTTGGYAPLAVLTRASRAALARLRAGSPVRLRITGCDDASRGILPP